MRRCTRQIQLLAAAIVCSIAAACGHLPDVLDDARNAPTSGGRTAGNPTQSAPVPASRSDAAMPAAVLLPESDEEVSVQELAVHHAMTMLGRPYRPGSETPRRGFDAPGLIHYVFTKAGGVVPRNGSELRSASGRVLISNVRLGDLLYFDLDGKKNSHVGIYIGDGRFVHASPALRRVRMERIDTPYWQRLLSEARRLDARRAVTSRGVSGSSQ